MNFGGPASTSEQQFQFCSICRRNHQGGERHVYSKSHKQSLWRVLNKFSAKVELMKKMIQNCPILQSNLGEKFWCHICSEEYEKHYRMDNSAGEFGGIAEHFASPDHVHQLDIFSRLHRIKREKLDKFSLNEERWRKYEKDVRRARDEHFRTVQERLNQEAWKIAVAERENEEIAHSSQQQRRQVGARPEGGPSLGGSVQSTGGGPGQAVRTVDARADGLTCIKIRDDDNDVRGNVHSGAPPPWLTSTSTSRGDDVIGPTADDYLAHQRQERRRKLPSCRVGADFTAQPSSSQWRPSFGQVFSKKRSKQRNFTPAGGSFRAHYEKTPQTPSAPLPALKRMKYTPPTS